MNVLQCIDDLCLLYLEYIFIFNVAGYSSNGITEPISEPISQPAVSQDQDEKCENSITTSTASSTVSQSAITPVKMNSKSKMSFMEKVSQRASALNMTRLSSELVLATGSSTLRYYQCLQLNYLMVGNL